MSERKATPGPWEIVSKFVGPYEIHAHGDRIALVGSDLDPFGEKYSVVDTARLIAAAPDLLQAVEDMAAILQAWEGHGLDRAGKEWLERSRAVIAKAKSS